MSQSLPANQACCPDRACQDPIVENIPGPQGPAGAPGADGTDGVNAFTTLTASFVVPLVGDSVLVSVVKNSWVGLGQVVYIENAGYYTADSLVGLTGINITNLGYPDNAIPTTVIPSSSKVSPGGKKGQDGTNSSGDMLGSNNLSDVDSVSASRTNLGGTTVGVNFFTLPNPSAIRFIRVNADNSVSVLTAAQMQTALSLVPGTNVQAWTASLQAYSNLVTAAGKMIYFTGLNAPATTDITSFGRSLVDDASASEARTTLGGVLPKYGLLGTIASVDLNAANNDNAVSIEASVYRIDKLTFENASGSVTTATAGVFTAAGGGGTTVAADQSLAALTASTKFLDLAPAGVVATDTFNSGTLYIRTGTAQGAPMTARVSIYGWKFS